MGEYSNSCNTVKLRLVDAEDNADFGIVEKTVNAVTFKQEEIMKIYDINKF